MNKKDEICERARESKDRSICTYCSDPSKEKLRPVKVNGVDSWICEECTEDIRDSFDLYCFNEGREIRTMHIILEGLLEDGESTVQIYQCETCKDIFRLRFDKSAELESIDEITKLIRGE